MADDQRRDPWFRPSGPNTVIAPEELRELFGEAQENVRRYFSHFHADPAQGRIEIGDERYVLVRASALSTDFLDTISQLYADRHIEEARAIGRAFLFDIAHTIGKNDARSFHRKMGLTDPLARLAAGPVHFSYSGWALVELAADSVPTANEDYVLIYDHPYSFEADSWLRAGRRSDGPVCIMNAGYSSGWSEESFGIALTAVEMSCKAAGDDRCQFLMAPPHRIEEHLATRRPDLASGGAAVRIPTYFARKREEDALRQSERRLRSILEATPMPVLIAREDGTVLYGNGHAEDVFGIDLQQRRTLRSVELFEAAGTLRNLFHAVKAGERVHGREYRMVGKGGEPFSALVSCHSILLPDGESGMVVTALDVTDYKRAEAALRVNERMATVGTLAAGVAHEINNPLAYVIANLEIVAGLLEREGPALGAELRAALARPIGSALEGATRVRDIVRDLRALSRDRDAADDEAVDIESALDRGIAMTSAEWKHRARIVRDYEGLDPIRGHEGRLGQVFLNLLINAAQAITEGAAERNEIRVSTRRRGDRVVIGVEDSGRGIPKSDLSRIFDPLFTTKEVGEGVGLGLAISKNIIQKLGGDITVESAVGRGTRVEVWLPAREPPPAPVAGVVAPGLSGLEILVVDDEPRIRDVFVDMLEDCRVTVADSGRAAREQLERRPFDVVLCDLMMPDVTGMELYESSPASVRKRMIFMTGGAFSRYAQEFLDRVGNPCLEKPIDVVELREAIRAHLAAL